MKAPIVLFFPRAVLALPLLCGISLFGQQPAKLTAREIFYGDSNSSQTASQGQNKPVVKPVSNTTGQVQKKPLKKNDPEVAANHDSTDTSHSTPSGTDSHVHVVNAAVESKPLGLRVSLVKITNDGRTVEVDSDASFRPGDRLRLNVEVSDPGYLYIVNRGSSGTWTPLFPSADIPEASNKVQPGTKYQVPQGAYFTVSDPPGEEKLFVILSRNPELDMGTLASDMSQRDKTTPIQPTHHTQTDTQPNVKQYAVNLPPINDDAVNRLRTTYSRDLIIEKVDETTPGTQKEKAVYAVNPTAGADSKVVLDVGIKHR
ncbi:MAG TPA: DUF4384 domain-containing protein [Bryobacteraceae bacterium]|nr:DUF4384 domain-containing protein [Bryobacteraceae bacterium]